MQWAIGPDTNRKKQMRDFALNTASLKRIFKTHDTAFSERSLLFNCPETLTAAEMVLAARAPRCLHRQEGVENSVNRVPKKSTEPFGRRSETVV